MLTKTGFGSKDKDRLAGQLEGVGSGVQGDVPARQQPHHQHRGAGDHVRHMLRDARRPDRRAVPGRIYVSVPLHVRAASPLHLAGPWQMGVICQKRGLEGPLQA